MSFVRPAALACSLACGAALLPGCRTAATEVDLAFVADCWPEGGRIRLLVWNDEDAMSEWELEPGGARTLVPRGGDASRRYRFEAQLLDGGGATVDVQRGEGGYVAGQESRREVRFATVCDDAGGGVDAGFELDAAPPTGCSRGPHVRATADLEVLYAFVAGSGDVVVNSAPGATTGTDLVGASGTTTWSATGARFGPTGRPTVPDPLRPERALSLCDETDEITLEAWITVEAEPEGDAREEVFTYGVPGEAMRNAFVLGIANGEVIAATNACDQQARPMYRFPRPGGLVHLAYQHRRIPLDAAFGDFDAGVPYETETWGQETAYVDGRQTSLRISMAPGEASAGCVPAGSGPGLRRFGVGVGGGTGETLHLGGAPWGGFRGTYHLLAIYCRALSAAEIEENRCAGPPHGP